MAEGYNKVSMTERRRKGVCLEGIFDASVQGGRRGGDPGVADLIPSTNQSNED
jgi:hypothetical protein